MNFNVAAYLQLTRFGNVIIGGLAIFVGSLLTGTVEISRNVMLACVSGCLILGAGNVINDYFDVEIDRLNKPHRPLPSAKIGRQSALYLTIILFALGNFLSIFISWNSFILGFSVSAGLVWYGRILKRKVLVGNIAVSLFSALAFVYGAIAVDKIQNILYPALFAFLFHLGREIIKDIEDIEADKANSAKTFAVHFGIQPALWLATITLVLLMISTFVPYWLDIYGKTYLLIVTVGVNIVISFVVLAMWFNPIPAFFNHLSFILKLDMLVGLAALYFGTFY